MGRWRNKGEAQPAPEAPRRNAKKKANQEMQAFNTRLFDPVNATIEHADKLEMQSLANAARGGDPQAVQAYQDKLWNSGLTQEEKLALGEMFTEHPPQRGHSRRIKATLPKEGTVGMEPGGGYGGKIPKELTDNYDKQIDPNQVAYRGPGQVGESYTTYPGQKGEGWGNEAIQAAMLAAQKKGGFGGGSPYPEMSQVDIQELLKWLGQRYQNGRPQPGARMNERYGMNGPAARGY